MDDQNADYNSITDIKRIMYSFSMFLLKRWWLLLLVISIGAAFGMVYYRSQKPRYEAICTFILEDKSSAGGGLSGLASQFGFNLGSAGGGSIFAGDNILEILKSKKVVQKVLLSHINGKSISNKTLADYYLEFTGNKKNWQRNPLLSNVDFAGLSNDMSPLQDSVLNSIYELIIQKNLYTERTSKQGTIIKVQVSAEDGLFARLMTERLIEEASKLYLDFRIGNGQENIRQLQRRSDSLLVLLNNKSYRAAASQPLDINPGIRTAAVPVEIANRDKTVLATLYAEVTKNLEASKLLLSQQTPVIQLLDRPGLLLPDNKKGMAFILIVGIIVAVLFYLAMSLFFFIFFRTKNNQLSTSYTAKSYS